MARKSSTISHLRIETDAFEQLVLEALSRASETAERSRISAAQAETEIEELYTRYGSERLAICSDSLRKNALMLALHSSELQLAAGQMTALHSVLKGLEQDQAAGDEALD